MTFDHSLNIGLVLVFTAAGYLFGGMEAALPAAAGAVVGTYGYEILLARREK